MRRSSAPRLSSAAMPAPGFVMSTVFVAMLAVTATAQAPPAAGGQPAADNYYAAGEHLVIAVPMPADVVVAGRDIEMSAPISGDILAAGWRVSLTARTDDDVRMAGGNVRIDAPVRGDLTVAGGDVTIGSQARVGGRTWVAGRTIHIDGVLDRDAHVAGADVQISGEIRQPLEVVAEHLEILPAARILAPLTYKGSTEAKVASGAQMSGPIAYTRIAEGDARRCDRSRASRACSSRSMCFSSGCWSSSSSRGPKPRSWTHCAGIRARACWRASRCS